MDLEALTSEQLELALKLADILSMEDLTVAAAVLSSFNWNIEQAVQELQIGPAQQNNPPLPKKPSNSEDYNYNVENEDYYQQDQEYHNEQDEYEYLIKQKKQMFQEEYVSLIPLQKTVSQPNKEQSALETHKRLAKDYRTHQKYYLEAILDNSEILCKKILDSNKEGMNKYYQNKRKIESNRNFINYLYNTYHPRVNFTFGTFFLNLTRAYLEGKYLLVYIHSEAPEVENKFKKIVELILKQKQISKFVNDNCIAYGMFDNSDDYELIQKYIPLKDLPAFALFRLNKNKRAEQFISSYKISSQGQIFLEWAAKSMGICLKKKVSEGMEQEKAIKQALRNAEMRKKKEQELSEAIIKKQTQYIAHRDIRKEQDELYAELQKTYKQKKQLSFDRRQNIKHHEQQLAKRREEIAKQVQPQSGADVIQIRFRMPVSGESKLRRFEFSSKIYKLYQYVDAFYRDQFQQKFNDFDLRQSFPQLSLNDKKDNTINQVFEGSNRQNIIIRQL